MKISANKTARTFTLRKYDKQGKCYTKYRTFQMDKAEFEQAKWYWTENDWKQFLKTDEYYIVK